MGTGQTIGSDRAVIKRRGPGISPGYYERGPRLLSWENRRKIEPNAIPSWLISRLLVVSTRQLEILATTLSELLTGLGGQLCFVPINCQLWFSNACLPLPFFLSSSPLHPFSNRHLVNVVGRKYVYWAGGSGFKHHCSKRVGDIAETLWPTHYYCETEKYLHWLSLGKV